MTKDLSVIASYVVFVFCKKSHFFVWQVNKWSVSTTWALSTALPSYSSFWNGSFAVPLSTACSSCDKTNVDIDHVIIVGDCFYGAFQTTALWLLWRQHNNNNNSYTGKDCHFGAVDTLCGVGHGMHLLCGLAPSSSTHASWAKQVCGGTTRTTRVSPSSSHGTTTTTTTFLTKRTKQSTTAKCKKWYNVHDPTPTTTSTTITPHHSLPCPAPRHGHGRCPRQFRTH